MSRAGTVGREYGVRPIILRIAGSTNSSKEMYDDTGLPGSVKIGVRSSPTWPKPCGLPGCIADRPEPHVPSGRSASLTTSKSPWETPPLVTTMSARTSWSCERVEEGARLVGDDADPVGDRAGPPGGGREQEGVAVVDRVVAQRRCRARAARSRSR